ncbi:MAG TPA: glycosyltransferase [Dehalococcoidia bacterium]|nr:glycosyltransferase [Dehalococcoidia bacterium]
MKVVFLADAPYIHTRRWIDHFVAEGFDCDVISFRPAEIEGARVHHINGAEPFGKARYLIHARRVRQLVHDLQPDLVHALHLTSYGFLGALSGAHPLIISVWGTDVLEAPHLTPFHGWLTRYALSHADAITATGLHLATETTRYAPRGKPVTVVPYGVDLERFAPKNAHPERRPEPVEGALEGRDSDDAPFVIGATSRFSPEKGVRYLVEAFALLRRRLGERAVLRLAGEGPERAKLEALARELGVADAVEFCGWLEHDALPAFLGSLDVFVLPSTYEGFGVSAVEASAAGLPIVATNVHGIPDVVRHSVTGLLVAPKDPQALADAIASLADDAPLRQRLGEAGRAYVAKHYDWHANAAQMDRLYEAVLALHKVAAGA